jgi:transcriptional regulator with XRE-family HTH domain
MQQEVIRVEALMQPKDLDGASHPRAFFGSELRRLREEAGLTQAELGQQVYISGSYIGQMEVGARWPGKREQVEAFDKVLNAGGHLLRVWELGERAPEYPGYFADQAKREQEATKVEDYSANIVFGLLQTPDYAKALFRAAGPYWTRAEIDEMVQRRMQRAAVLDSAEGPTSLPLWEILDEAALRRCIGSPKTMRAQLLHLKGLMETHRIVLQVLPFSGGAHALSEGSVTVMEFADLPTVAYVEGPNSGRAMTDRDQVRTVRRRYDLVRAAALSPEASHAFIDSAMKEHAP